VPAAARGHPNARIAAGLGISAGTVRKWRGRFTASDLHDLLDRVSRHEQQDNPQDKPLLEAT
jgi:FixJ family two-component response regulator